MRVQFEGQTHEFPDDFTDRDIAAALQSIGKPASEQKPQMPFYASTPSGEVNINAGTPQAAQVRQQMTQEQTARDQEQAQFDASRTPGNRLLSTATFAGSLPVRMLTQGEYGLGDVARLVAPETGNALSQSEAEFARANKTGLQYAADAGAVLAGIPELSQLGAVPGQVLKSGANALRRPVTAITEPIQAYGEFLPSAQTIKRFATEERGSGPIAGGPLLPPSPPPPQPAQGPAATPFEPGRIPTRDETFAAAERLKGLSTPDQPIQVDIPEMVAGKEWQQKAAAGLKTIPFAGDPIEQAYQRGLQQMETAKAATGQSLGTAQGAELSGQGVKQGALGWIRKNSKEILQEKYGEVANSVDQNVTRPLSATANVVKQLRDEMAISTDRSATSAIDMVDEALSRSNGLSAKGVQDLRTAIGRKIDAAATVPDPADAAYKRLYGALDKDLQATLKQAGGDKALQAWQNANREAKIIAGKRQRIAQVIGTDEMRLSDEAVFKKIQSIASDNTSNLKNLRQMKEVVGPKDWGNMAAEVVNRIGVDPKTNLFSGDRFLTAYGKYSNEAKDLLFGSARQHLDDIAVVARKFGELSSKFNRSNTAIGTAVQKFLQFLANPAVLGAEGAAAVMNPAAAGALALQGTGLMMGRKLAWSLAKPSSATQASRVFRAYYGLVSAQMAARSAQAIAAKEQALNQTIRIFSLSVAKQTGQNAAEIEKSFRQNIDELGKSQ